MSDDDLLASVGELFEGSKVVRHGTQSGWGKHRKQKTPMCDRCRRAKEDYDHKRLQDPTIRRRQRARARAQSQAYSRLAKLHPKDYQKVYREEVEKAFKRLDEEEPARKDETSPDSPDLPGPTSPPVRVIENHAP